MTIKINGTNTAANPSITGTDTDTGIVYGSDQIDFSTGGSSKVTLNGSNFGIGTQSPDVDFHVSGGSSVGKIESTTASTSARLIIKSANDTYTGLHFGDDADDDVGRIRYYHNTDNMLFYTGASERMRLLSGGGLTFNGDTAAANALNDYEEGYWSPTAMDGIPITTNNTGNHPSRRYVKIGKIVFAYFDFTFGNQFNAFGARFGGLPITVAAGGGHGANASTNGYTNLQQEYFLHVSGTNPAIFKSNGAQFTHNEVSSKRFAGCIIYSTD